MKSNLDFWRACARLCDGNEPERFDRGDIIHAKQDRIALSPVRCERQAPNDDRFDYDSRVRHAAIAD